MTPCCDLCYYQYINQDGTVDTKYLAEACKERNLPQAPVHWPQKLCTCECHVKGNIVLH